MTEFIKVNDKASVLSLLIEFSDIFPHLFEKIESPDSYAEKISKLANIYVAKQDGNNFGIAVFYSNDTTDKKAYISLIGLKEASRGKGQGSWLLSQCERLAENDGMTQVLLEVDSDNTSAIRFYEKNGYSVVEYSDRNSMYMKKILNLQGDLYD